MRLYKQNQHEGGISSPLIVHWPAGLKTSPGTITHQPGHLIDFMATFLDLCDADYLSNLDLSRQPDTGLVDTKVDLSPVHGLVFTVATTLDQGPESVRVAIDVYNAFDQRNLVVGKPSVSQSIVSFSVQIGEACTLTKPLNLLSFKTQE